MDESTIFGERSLRATELELMAVKQHYLGVLGLLAETSVMLRDNGAARAVETRDLIAQALDDAQEIIPQLRWRRVLDAFVVEVL